MYSLSTIAITVGALAFFASGCDRFTNEGGTRHGECREAQTSLRLSRADISRGLCRGRNENRS